MVCLILLSSRDEFWYGIADMRQEIYGLICAAEKQSLAISDFYEVDHFIWSEGNSLYYGNILATRHAQPGNDFSGEIKSSGPEDDYEKDSISELLDHFAAFGVAPAVKIQMIDSE